MQIRKGTDGEMCREPDLNRRTPARLDPESSAVGQAWLSLHVGEAVIMVVV